MVRFATHWQFLLILLLGGGATPVFAQPAPGPESTAATEAALQETWAAYLASTPRAPGAQTVTLTFPRAIELALVQNREILGGRIDVAAAMQSVLAADARFETRFRPTGRVGTGQSTEQLGTGLRVSRLLDQGTEVAVVGAYDNSKSGDFRFERGRVGVELSQPLFRNFGRMMTMEPVVRAGSALKQAKRSFERRKEDLVLEVVSQYEGVLRSERLVELEEKAVRRLDDFLVLTQSLERQGKGSRIDTLRVEQQLGQAKTRLENSRDNLHTGRQDFNDLVGAPLDAPVLLTEPPLIQLKVPRAEAATAIALSNRMDYAQLLNRIEDTDRATAIAERNLQPDIRLAARYRQQNPLDKDPFELTQSDWFAGLTLGSNVDNREEEIAYARARLAGESLGLNQADLKYSIARDVRNQIRAYQTAQSTLRIAGRNAKLAADRLELAQTFYRIGQGDNFTLIEAETDYLQALNAQLNARAEASNSGFRLLRAMGILISHPEPLKPGWK